MTVISMALHGKTIAACPLHNRRVEVWALCTIPEINGPLLGGWLTPLQTHPGGYHKGCLLVWQVDTAAPCHALIIGARRRPAEALLQLVRRQTTPSGVQIRKERKKERKKRRTEEGGWCISAARACFMWRGEKIGRRQRSMEKSWEERKGQKKGMNFESYAIASLGLGCMKRKVCFIHSDVGGSTGTFCQKSFSGRQCFCAHESVHPLTPCMHQLWDFFFYMTDDQKAQSHLQLLPLLLVFLMLPNPMKWDNPLWPS